MMGWPGRGLGMVSRTIRTSRTKRQGTLMVDGEWGGFGFINRLRSFGAGLVWTGKGAKVVTMKKGKIVNAERTREVGKLELRAEFFPTSFISLQSSSSDS